LPSWDRVRAEITSAQAGSIPQGQSAFDVVRRRKLRDLARYLNRPVVLYAVDCLTPSPKTTILQQLLGPAATMIEVGDKDAFSEVLEEIEGGELALVLHSPGGFAETAEAIVEMLRSRFHDISVIVPMYAKSAATMLALSGDRLLLDDHSELGPIDPQFNFPARGVTSPAARILSQFDEAAKAIAENPERLPAWVPILEQYAPSLLEDAREAWDLAHGMVERWLERYMFASGHDAARKANKVARYFSGRDEHDKIARTPGRSASRSARSSSSMSSTFERSRHCGGTCGTSTTQSTSRSARRAPTSWSRTTRGTPSCGPSTLRLPKDRLLLRRSQGRRQHQARTSAVSPRVAR
jgi:Serine dehydrogenase proteinase